MVDERLQLRRSIQFNPMRFAPFVYDAVRSSFDLVNLTKRRNKNLSLRTTPSASTQKKWLLKYLKLATRYQEKE
jgi:hypothetical protein